MGRRIVHPAFLGGVAVLAVNDHFLKGWWPGFITGKLSDFAGVFVVAVLATFVVRRRLVGVVLAGLGFAAIKVSVEVAELAAPLLGGVTRQDWTDLTALVMVPVAYRYLAQFDDSPQTISGPATGARWWPGRAAFIERTARTLALAVAGVVTALSLTATSCAEHPTISGFAVVPDGVVAVGSERDFLSVDGGQTWTETIRSNTLRLDGQQACTAAGRCFRVADGERVEELVDGQWQVAFTYTDREVEAMDFRADGCSGEGSTGNLFRSVAVSQTEQAEVVLVAMDSQGALRYDLTADTWTRVAIGPSVPASLDPGPASWLRLAVVIVPIAVMLGSPLLLLVRRETGARWARYTAAAMTGLLGAAVVVIAFLVALLAATSAGFFGVWRLATIVAMTLFGAALLLAALAGANRDRDPEGDPPDEPDLELSSVSEDA